MQHVRQGACAECRRFAPLRALGAPRPFSAQSPRWICADCYIKQVRADLKDPSARYWRRVE